MSGWRMVPLGKLCRIELGKTPARRNANLWDPHKKTDNVWLSIADLSQAINAEVTDSKEYVSNEGAAICKVVPKGTLLVSFKLTLGRLAFAGRDLFTNEAIAALTIRNETRVSKTYLYWYLTFFDWDKAAEGDHKVKGKTLNKKKLNVLPILLPPSLDEQARIVAILDEAFAAIAVATAHAERNLINARAVFESYLEANLRQPDYTWEEKTFGDDNLLQIIDGDRGKNYPKRTDFHSSEYCLFLNTKNVRPDGFNFEDTAFITKGKDVSLRKGKLKRRDVILTTRGTVGNVAIYDGNVEYENIRINSGMLILRPNESIVTSEYLFEVLRSGFAKKQISKLTSGAAQPQLPVRALIQLTIPIPGDLRVQQRIVENLRILYKHVEQFESIYQRKLDLIAELKQSLLQQAFRGELTSG